MKKASRRTVTASVLVIVFLTFLFFPGLPWSARCHHILNRLIAKAEMNVAAWQGVPPKLISLSGRVIGKRAGKEALKGAEVEVLDSISGWAALTDEQGEFIVPDVMWYPGAKYTLIIMANEYQARRLQVSAPGVYPQGGIVKLGELEFEKGCRVDVTDMPGKNSISYVKYDGQNSEYYEQLFDELTADKDTDEERLNAINRYVAKRFITTELAEDFESPREVLERGSRYCGKLALTLATIAEAGNYKVRILDMIDAASQRATHVVTEVYYGDRWHLYDPLIGEPVRNGTGAVINYKEIKLDTGFKLPEAMPEHLPEVGHEILNVYRSGFHHYYYLRR